MRVLRRLRAAGHQAYFAGGCVRDMLLGLRSSDYDIATDATPQQVRKLFAHVLLVGAKFGVAMVIHDKRKVEVTTFRSDLAYADGRRPVGVVFSSPREDALRRDFTINGMFYDPVAREVIDYVGGRKDLKWRTIRTIGDPDERFGEDYLRLIRAVRFAVRLDFTIEPFTAVAISRHAGKIASISGERIFEELTKMLQRSSAGAAMRKLDELGLACAILPEMFASPAVWQVAVERLELVQKRRDLPLSLGALLVGLSEKQIIAITRRWGASNELRELLCWMSRNLERWHSAAAEGEVMSLAEFKRLIVNPDFELLRRLWMGEELRQRGRQLAARRIGDRMRNLRARGFTMVPLVTGDDLKTELSLVEGQQLGSILRTVYDAQLNERIQTRQEAIDLARRLLSGSAIGDF